MNRNDPNVTRAQVLQEALDDSVQREIEAGRITATNRSRERAGKMPEAKNEAAPDAAVALMRIVDFRIPLPYLLTGFVLAIGALVGMYYQLQALNATIVRLEVGVATGNAQMLSIASDVAHLKFRTEQLERDLARINGMKDNR